VRDIISAERAQTPESVQLNRSASIATGVRMKNKGSPQPTEVFNPHQPLPELKDLVLWREGNLVTAQWRGSPKFSVGVLSALNDDQAFERAAESMSLAVKPGFKEAEMKACAKEIRRRAEVNTAARLVN
jgi:hypothetical protein